MATKHIVVTWKDKDGLVTKVNINVVNGVCHGDVKELLELVTPYFVTCIYEKSRAYGLPIPVKEEVISDITVLVLTHVVNYDPKKASFKTYLYNIIRNRIYDMAFRGWASLTEPGHRVPITYDSEHPAITGEQNYDEEEY